MALEARVGRFVDFVIETSVNNAMREMWLEVRESNDTAIAIYESSGFEHMKPAKLLYRKSNDDGHDEQRKQRTKRKR